MYKVTTLRILIVEDNQDLAGNLLDYLSALGCAPDYASDAKKALKLITDNSYDVLILDVMMPFMNGFQLCQTLRQHNINAPILFLTAKDTLEDKQMGFDAGADDYLVKPFALRELWMRLNALTRRRLQQTGTQLSCEDLTFNLDSQEVMRAGQSIQLNRSCLKLLRCLLQHSPDVVSREDLEYVLWKDDVPDNDVLRTHLYTLRTKLDKPFSTSLIKTIHGIGFCLRPNTPHS